MRVPIYLGILGGVNRTIIDFIAATICHNDELSSSLT